MRPARVLSLSLADCLKPNDFLSFHCFLVVLEPFLLQFNHPLTVYLW